MEDKENQDEQYVMAIVRPKKSTRNNRLMRLGIACFCGGLGIGTGMGFVTWQLHTNQQGIVNQQERTAKAQVDSEERVVAIAEHIGPCVVSVYNNKKVSALETSVYTADNKGEVLYGLGSGIIFKEDDTSYYILTNSHVVQGADSLAVNFLGDVKAACQLVGKDSENDVAVVKVLKAVISPEVQKQIGIAPLGNSDTLKAGQLAVAIGTPATDALNNTVTSGIISATQRNITISGTKMTVIQTDAAINPGNSGGALVGPTGEVIGMNVAKTSNTEGIGFALPINVVKPIAEDLMLHGSVVRPGLGIMGMDISQYSAQLYDLPVGVYIKTVLTGGSADLAGIKEGDILIQFEGETITSMVQLKALIAKKRVGDVVTVKVIREKMQKTFQLELVEMPE